MTFLNPFVLFGLAAAAIPIVLHLLNIRKLRTIEFSTLAFLKELQKSKMRRVKIRQLLLLFLRTLLVVLIVMAFSRPALKGTLSGIGTHARTTIVIILDDTYSMSLQNERGIFLKQAQSAALRLADMLKEGDDALFIRLSELPLATIPEPTHDIQKLRSAIRQTEPSYKHRTVEEALRLSSRLIRQSKNFNKEIYIVSDNQKTTAIDRPSKERSPLTENLSDVKLFLVPLSEKPFENIGIEKVEIPPTLFQKGKPFPVRATVRNFGTTRVQNHLINMFLDGVRIMQKSVSLEGGARNSVEFTVTPQHTGFLSGYLELEEDAFDGDNKFFFTATIPAQLNVVLASSDRGSTTNIRLALNLLNRDGSSTALALNELPPGQLTSAALGRTNVVILANAAAPSPSQADQLAQFTSQGGGIVFFPGDLVNAELYNGSLLPKLGLPPLRPAQRRPDTSFLLFDKIDYSHPVFQGMFEKAKGLREKNGNIESPKVFSSIRFASEKDIRSIISLSDGTPFLWEKMSRETRVLGFAVAPTIAWSDFPVKGIFVPLLYQTILYAASGASTLAPLPAATVGDRVEIPLSKSRRNAHSGQSTVSQTVAVIDPNSKVTLVQISPASLTGGSATLTFDKSTQPGVYTVVQSKDTVAQIPVNIDPLESNGERMPFDEFTAMSERLGAEQKSVTLVKDPETIDAVVLQSRFGVELWKYFLIAAIVVAMTEMLVARESKQDVV